MIQLYGGGGSLTSVPSPLSSVQFGWVAVCVEVMGGRWLECQGYNLSAGCPWAGHLVLVSPDPRCNSYSTHVACCQAHSQTVASVLVVGGSLGHQR